MQFQLLENSTDCFVAPPRRDIFARSFFVMWQTDEALHSVQQIDRLKGNGQEFVPPRNNYTNNQKSNVLCRY